MPLALITGASRGLGLALARALADRGWALVIDARHIGDLDAVARELGERTEVAALAGDIADPDHRRALLHAAGDTIDLLVNNASVLGPSPQLALPRMPDGAAIVNVTSDAAVEAYPGWGGYGSAKAALEQLSAILAAEQPSLRVLTVDPGDMRTRMHQEAFPGEDISDRPPPEESVPGLLALIDRGQPSGRYRAREAEVPA
jgi:NAD(P)-dependent dehydrogenase (short-subunit alcohol dehydrogenase family)